MRIGILTLPLHTNYGGILQAYALQTILEKLGHTVTIFDTPKYKEKLTLRNKLKKYPKRIVKKILKGKHIKIDEEKYYNQTYPIISQHTSKFIGTYIHRIEISNLNSLSEKDFDAIIVGSDQIWRPSYYKPIEDAFLKFAQNWNIKKIAYAASFGADKWEYNENQTKECRTLLKKFTGVSLREEKGLEFINNYMKSEGDLVLDPTMLLKAQDYINLFINKAIPQSNGNLLCYFLDETSEKNDLADKISQTKNLKLFNVNSKVEDVRAKLELRIQPSVEQWIKGFFNTQFVITDSFHACVFSIIFNKPFIVIANEKRGLSRFTTLLSHFGLQKHLYRPDNAFDIENDFKLPPDINEKLDCLREKSISFLNKNL